MPRSRTKPTRQGTNPPSASPDTRVTTPDPGSFRDPASHIVHDGERVLRLLDARGLEGWRALSSSRLFADATSHGKLIASKEVEPPLGYAGAIEHPRLDFISYPYEWTFGMLKDAALLQLELLSEALPEGLTIKDATPFNIQFQQGRPLFIDIGSFEPYRDGEAWIGYRQFTRQFLFPLMMRAWASLPFQPWLRGDMEGPTASQMRRLLPMSKRLRPASLMHVTLQARMEDRLSGEAVRADLKKAGFGADLIMANVRRLISLVDSMELSDDESTWSEYQKCDHVGRDRDVKSEFLESLLRHHHPNRVLDLGANDGHFSAIAAEHGAHAIAVDGDETVLEALYRESAGKSISVVVNDLTNPTPAQGWASAERASLAERADPDLVIAFGLIHHLVYTASIPPRSVVDWLAEFGCPIALEFVSPEDEMVQRLIANKLEEELHPGRSEGEFREALQTRFDVTDDTTIADGKRALLALTPR